jgi:hypothetical protein
VVATHPGAFNTYVQDHAASGHLVVDFSRNIQDFALNQYVKIIPSEKMTGLWLEMTLEEAARVIGNDEDHSWADGADRPSLHSNDGTESFNFLEYRTDRKEYGFRLGNLTVGQASWDIVSQHARVKAQQAMTARTVHVLSLITASGNYPTGHSSAAASIAGNTGTWAASTSSRQDIQRSLNFAAKKINIATLGVVKKKDLICVISPDVATEIAECQEIVEMLKGSRHTEPYITGDLWSNSEWGLPPTLYGVNLVVEDTVRVTTRKGGTQTKEYALNDDKAMLLARPGALEGMYGSPEFSSASMFMFSDMEVWTKDDRDNERTNGSIIDNRVAKFTSPVSSFLFSDVIA